MPGGTNPGHPCISIHAPLAGCDPAAAYGAPPCRNFNPRTPCGVRPGGPLRGRGARDISIHAPLAGCDGAYFGAGPDIAISIHAPLAGCDEIQDSRGSDRERHFNPRTPCGVRRRTSPLPPHNFPHFNPRTPCGVRQLSAANSARRSGFQSTHPLRGATCTALVGMSETGFQSTHPLRGATAAEVSADSFCSHFNPRTPCGVRRRPAFSGTYRI